MTEITKTPVEELCTQLLTDELLYENTMRLIKLCNELKIINKLTAGNTYTFTYRGKYVLKLFFSSTPSFKGFGEADHSNSLYVSLSVGNKSTNPEQFLASLPNDLRAEYLSSYKKTCGACSRCGEYYIEYEENSKKYPLCTSSFGYSRHNPTSKQFDMIERFIKLRKERIEELKILEKHSAQEGEKTAQKQAKRKPTPDANGEISIFERTNAEQKLVKPKIEDCFDYFIKDSTLRETINNLFIISCDLDMTPVWRSKNRYDGRYKKKDMVKFRFEDMDLVNVTIYHETWRERPDDIKKFILALPDDKKLKYVNFKQTNCHTCRGSCMFTFNLEVMGQDFLLCTRPSYNFENPRPGQVSDIKFFLELMMDYTQRKNG